MERAEHGAAAVLRRVNQQADIDVRTAATIAAEEAAGLVANADVIVASLHPERPEVFEVLAGTGGFGAEMTGTEWPVEGSLNGLAMLEQRIVESYEAAAVSSHGGMLAAHGKTACLLVPLEAARALPGGRRGVGVLGFWRDGPEHFDDEQRAAAGEFARLIGGILHRVEVLNSSHAQTHRLERVVDALRATRSRLHDAHDRALASVAAVARHIDMRSDNEPHFGVIAATVADTVGAERVVFTRLGGDGTLVPQDEGHGIDATELAALAAEPCEPGSGTIADRVVHEGQAFRVAHGGPDSLLAEVPMAVQLGAHDAILCAWYTGDQPQGALVALDSARDGGFTDEDLWVLQMCARAAGLVWQHHEAQARLAAVQTERTTQLAALEQAKTQLLNLASHELRGPIGILQGYLAMIHEGALGEVPEALAGVVPLLRGKVAEMNMLVDGMLEAARLEDERLKLSITCLDLRTIVRRAADTVVGMQRDANRVSVDLPSQALFVDGDPVRLGIVVGNLVHNALKYSPDGGPVDVRLMPGAGEAVLEVEDHGIGIRAVDMRVLFTRFGRIVTPDNSHIQGTGLGLFLARELARLHGGDIVASSVEGRGSTFRLTLPLAATAPPAGGFP